jgi:hypothetical protein
MEKVQIGKSQRPSKSLPNCYLSSEMSIHRQTPSSRAKNKKGIQLLAIIADPKFKAWGSPRLFAKTNHRLKDIVLG